MKAAILPGLRQPFRIEEVPVPKLGPDEVLIETRACGLCRTDLHIQDGLAYTPSFPHVPGHEPAGVVFAVGERVDNVLAGQRVTLHLFLTCGSCCYCRSGRDAQCSRVEGIIGVTQPGGFAQYFKAPARNLLPLPDTVSFEAGGLVSCAVITAVHAYRRARLQVNDTAVVIGAGGIGRMLVQLLRAAGLRVAAVSRSASSLAAASQDGAVLTVSSDDGDTAEQVNSFTSGEGAHCVFDCVGTAATMKAAAQFSRRCGQIVVIGEEPEFPPIDTIEIAQRELEIIGSRNGSTQDGADAIQLIAAGIIRPPVAARYPLEGLNEAMQVLRAGQAGGRLVITEFTAD
jgi:propanol-preferring alcohol dehydrogenase